MIDQIMNRGYAPGYQPLRPHDYWPWEYELQSRREGWILSNDSDDCTTISRIDNPSEVEPELEYDQPKFAGDMEAQTWVIDQASKGSALHLLAVYLLGFPVGQPLNMDPPDRLLPPGILAEKQVHRLNKAETPLKEYQFDMGDSTDGPIGLSAAIHATSKLEALDRLRAVLSAHTIIQLCSGRSPPPPCEYVNIYLSPDNITADTCQEICPVA